MGQADRDQADLAEDLRDFGRSLNDEGLWPAAEVALLEAVAMYEGMTDPDPDEHVWTLVNLCGALAAQGKLVETNDRLAQAEELVIEAHGESSLEHAEDVLYPIGRKLSWVDRGREAISLFRRVAETCSPLGQAGIDRCRYAELRLAKELVLLGETEEALRIAQAQIEYWREARGETYWAVGEARTVLGLAHLGAGNNEAAETALRKALHVLQINLEERDNPISFAETKAALAECLTSRGDHAQAELLLLDAHELVREYGKDRPRAQRYVLERLVTLYETWGKPVEAARWRDFTFE